MNRRKQHNGTRRCLTAAATGLLLITTLIAAAAPPTVAAETTSWSWRAPADADGPGAFRVTVDFGDENRCDMSAGGASDLGNGPMAFVSLGEGYEGMQWVHHFVQVHSNAVGVDTRDTNGAGGMKIYRYDAVSGVLDLTVLVSDMSGAFAGGPDEWAIYPAEISIDCDDPFEIVGASGSREVVGFTDMSLEGTGADAGGFIVPGVSVNLDDTLQATFASGSVEVDIWDDDTTAEVRSWDLVTPTQSFEGMSTHLSLEDGPGDYLFSLTGAGDCPGCIGGWMAGYEPAGSLDEILA